MRTTALLAVLKALRLEIARERGVPAYVVFTDRSLIDMARRRPRTEAEFAEVNGVGAVKLEQFAEVSGVGAVKLEQFAAPFLAAIEGAAVRGARERRRVGGWAVTIQLVITEKSSQARDVRAAVGSRFGKVLAAEGHLLELREPEEVNPAWKRWSTELLKPDGLYGTKPASGGNKAAKLKAIRAALKTADRVWARHRLRPRGAADRPGDPGALPLSGRGVSRDVHRAGFGDHPRGVPERAPQRRARPALRGGGRAPAGGPDLQPVADPNGHRDAGPGFAGCDRGRAGEDADACDRLPARAGDPRVRAAGVFRGGGCGARSRADRSGCGTRRRNASPSAPRRRRSSTRRAIFGGRSGCASRTRVGARHGCTTCPRCRSCAARGSAGRPRRRWPSPRSSMTGRARRS